MWVKRRWLVGYSGSSHGNYAVTGQQTGPHKCEVTHMRTINYLHTGCMAESINTLFVVSRGRENGLNKVYPYRKQAQVQYINLAWRNAIGKTNVTQFIRRNKDGTVVAPPPSLGQTMRTNFILTMQTFPYKITINIQ